MRGKKVDMVIHISVALVLSIDEFLSITAQRSLQKTQPVKLAHTLLLVCHNFLQWNIWAAITVK